MRCHINCEGIKIDLDDPNTYKDICNNLNKINNKIYKEIGYILTYMKYINSDVYNKSKKKRKIMKIIKYFITHRKDNLDNIIWNKEQLYLLLDETENML